MNETSKLDRKPIARERVEPRPHRFEVNPSELNGVSSSVINMLKWQFVTVGDLEDCASDTLRALDASYAIRGGNIDTLTKYESIMIMFGLLMSNQEPEKNGGKLKYNYIYKGPFSHRRKHIYLDDIYCEVDDFIADGKLQYPREEEDGKQILVPYGWAQSVLDLMGQGVWQIEYDEKHHLYVAVFHEEYNGNTGLFTEPPKQIVGRKAQPCWRWELKGPVGLLLL